MTLPAELDLNPSVTLRPLATLKFELFDARTELHLDIEGVRLEAEEGAPGGTISTELQALLDELALCGTGVPLQEVRRKQLAFLDEQTWDERLDRLRELLTFSVTNVPFYRDRAAAYDPTRIGDRQSLAALPLLHKADVRSAFVELCSEDVDLAAEVASQRLALVATSGTTEDRLQALSDTLLVRIPENYSSIWAIPAPPETPRTAVLTSATCMSERCTLHPGEIASRIVHEHTLYLPALRDPFSIEEQEVRAIAAELSEFAPAFLFVNPVYAQCFGLRVRELGVRLPQLQMVISSFQYLSHVQRQNLVELFDAPVRNMYSATELGGCQLGLECHRGRLHLRDDHCLVELVGPQGPVSPGHLGAVVVTTLAARVMPLVRYAVGDLGVRSMEPCDCPLWQSPSLELHGRDKEALYVAGRWVTTRRLDDAIGAYPGLDFYCLRQLEDASLQLEVVPSRDQPFDGTALGARLEDWLGGVKVRLLARRRLSPAPSLKYPLSVRGVDTPPWLPPRRAR